MELTFAILKPHVTRMPHVVKDIRRRIIQNGFYVIQTKKLLLGTDQAHTFYKEHKGKFFFNRLVTFMTSGPCFFHVLAKEDAIQSWRAMMGPTKIFKTVHSHPLTIRGLHGLTDTRNATHGSDSVESATREINIFFPEFDVSKWHETEMEKFVRGEVRFDHEKFVHLSE